MRMSLHQPRYLLGSARAGSSPAGVDLFVFSIFEPTGNLDSDYMNQNIREYDFIANKF